MLSSVWICLSWRYLRTILSAQYCIKCCLVFFDFLSKIILSSWLQDGALIFELYRREKWLCIYINVQQSFLQKTSQTNLKHSYICCGTADNHTTRWYRGKWMCRCWNTYLWPSWFSTRSVSFSVDISNVYLIYNFICNVFLVNTFIIAVWIY